VASIGGRLRRFFFGSSRLEALLLAVLFLSAMTFLALGSAVKGIGYDDCMTCSGPEGWGAVTLNPAFYLPYSLLGHDRGISVDGPTNLTLRGYFESTPALYAWTVAWWVYLAFVTSRIVSMAIFAFRRHDDAKSR